MKLKIIGEALSVRLVRIATSPSNANLKFCRKIVLLKALLILCRMNAIHNLLGGQKDASRPVKSSSRSFFRSSRSACSSLNIWS